MELLHGKSLAWLAGGELNVKHQRELCTSLLAEVEPALIKIIKLNLNMNLGYFEG